MRPRKEGERRRNLFQLNMEDGSTSPELAEKPSMQHGRPQKPGPWPPKIDPFVPRTDHNPRELKSWAKRTGFNPKFSGETATTLSEVDLGEETEPPSPTPPPNPNADLQRGLGFSKQRTSLLPSSSAPPVKTEIEPILGNRRTRCENVGVEIKAVPTNVDKRNEVRDESEDLLGRIRRTDNNSVAAELELSPKNDVLNRKGGFSNGIPKVTPVVSPEEANKNWEDKDRGDVEIGMLSGSEDPDYPFPSRPSGLNCDLTENPGFPKLIYFGLQHYLSLAGSLVFIPSIIVPTMGGSDEDTATVISTMLLISGITTILHSYFGTRLPLVQGSSFVYLAPALVIINSEQFRNLSENKFKHIMRELQGAIIVSSLFQTVLGYSGLMSLILRLINPMVVAPTVAAVGLAYFSYGFPQTGTCAAISIPQIVLVLIFTLYLRRISVFGHRVFLIYAVPLSIAIMWAIAFFTTAGGAYDYKDCNPNIPTSNILLDACRKHVISMKQCRTDVSNAWRTAAWVRIPYPLQWGSPTFHFRTSFIMAIVSLVASVDSVGSYHATSLLINIKPPTPGIVSRGIGLEGCTSILAGLWGTGTGSTTLTENVHTIDVTKMAGRRAIETGAAFLILFSFVGKIGAILASIPLALSASVLCFTWALIVALGLSTLQYTQTASSRNVIIVGFSLFLSLSLPAYVQQYQPISSLVLPSYLLPYSAASNGPVHTGNPSLDYALNALLSLNMVVALFVAFILDNTVPGGRQERGAYIWSSSSRGSDGTYHDPSLSGYYLPETISRFFSWVKWVGS